VLRWALPQSKPVGIAARVNSKQPSTACRTTAEMGKRQYVVKGTTFEVDDRYEVKKGVGQGAYGLICAAKDTQSDDQVAIKKISNAFEDAIDCKRMLREMRLLSTSSTRTCSASRTS